MLEKLDIPFFVIDENTKEEQVQAKLNEYQTLFQAGGQAAFVIRKGGLVYDGKASYKNAYTVTREEVIRHVVQYSGEDPIVSTTGKASRELFEIREQQNRGHQHDFLTVGSMGHSSSIALGIALQKKDRVVSGWGRRGADASGGYGADWCEPASKPDSYCPE